MKLMKLMLTALIEEKLLDEFMYVVKVLDMEADKIVEDAIREKLLTLHDEQPDEFQVIMTLWHDRREQAIEDAMKVDSIYTADFDGIFGDLVAAAKLLKEAPITEDNRARVP